MSSTWMKWPGWMRPSVPSCCCQAILARREPSGQGVMLPDWAALKAMSLPRMKRKVLLSPRSVVAMTFQDSKVGSKARPFHSGDMEVREMGAAGGVADAVAGG